MAPQSTLIEAHIYIETVLLDIMTITTKNRINMKKILEKKPRENILQNNGN